MTSTFFWNPGELDLRAVTTMGVNAKVNESPIGFFGTGMKYAIATLLRHSCDITIRIGLKQYVITAEDELIRDKLFRVVFLRDTSAPAGEAQRLGFTTDLGKNWELWMAFREVYSNMMDEKGEMFEHSPPPAPRDGTTCIEIHGDAFATIAAQKDKYFIGGRKLLWKNKNIELYDGASEHFFYRGVRAGDLPKPARYTWNIVQQVKLTEDRTIASVYNAESLIYGAIMSYIDDEDLLYKILYIKGLKAAEATLEGSGGSVWGAPSDAISNVATRLGLRHCPLWVWGKCREAAPLEQKTRVREPTAFEKKVIARAAALFTTAEMDVLEYPVFVADDLGEGVLGLAEIDEQRIYLSTQCLRMGTKQVASTLLEEYLHVHHGWRDMTRELQTGLFDIIITLIEKMRGEPL